MKMRFTDRQAISALIVAGSGRCVARCEQNGQSWEVEYQGRLYRVVFYRDTKRVSVLCELSRPSFVSANA